MKAVLLKDFGGPEQLHVAEVPEPGMNEGQVLIRVHATSVNRPDIVQRQGNYAPPKGESEILGLEVAGTVEAVGGQVRGWKTGDRVCALIGGGGYAQFAVAWPGHMIRIPDSFSFEEAACICETYLTAYLNLFLLGQLEDGEAVLLHGGGGGVNTAGIDLCRCLVPGCHVIVTASPAKIERVRERGAATVIDYRNQVFSDEVKAVTSGHGADVILDHLGGSYLAPNMRCLAVGGRLLEIGVVGGAKAELNLALLMVKRQRIIGSVLRSRSMAEKGEIIARFTQQAMPFFEQGAIAPLISHVYALDEIRQAHETMQESRHFGKIVLAVSH